MVYQQLPPPYHISNYVRYFWTLESAQFDSLPRLFGPLADGCPGIIFQPSALGIYYDQQKQLPEIFLYGQTLTRTALHFVGKFQTIGICFYPNALKSIFGFNANEITDSCLNLNLLKLSKSVDVLDQLLTSRSVAAQIKSLSDYLLSSISENNVALDRTTQHALTQIIQTKGRISLKDIHKKLNVTERTFERKFSQYVGISPKIFSRICRFQAALSQIKSRDYINLSDIAFDNGFADQSHFIRTFKEFAGLSPYAFLKQADNITGITLYKS